MRRWRAWWALLVLAAPVAALALERAPGVAATDPEPWPASAGCGQRMSYFNLCAGTYLHWPDLPEGTRFGFRHRVNPFCPNPIIEGTYITTLAAVPTGYGLTGLIEIVGLDNQGYPTGPPLATQPFIADDPAGVWVHHTWPGVLVPHHFAVIYTVGPTPNPLAPLTDKPTDLVPCLGERVTGHSYFFGTAESPEWPGTLITEGGYPAELWGSVDGWHLTPAEPVWHTSAGETETSTWGRIKAMHR